MSSDVDGIEEQLSIAFQHALAGEVASGQIEAFPRLKRQLASLERQFLANLAEAVQEVAAGGLASGSPISSPPSGAIGTYIQWLQPHISAAVTTHLQDPTTPLVENIRQRMASDPPGSPSIDPEETVWSRIAQLEAELTDLRAQKPAAPINVWSSQGVEPHAKSKGLTERMGCTASAPPAPAASRRGDDEYPPTLYQQDLRWDDDGFNQWADECSLQWIRVDFLRHLHDTRRLLPACQECPSDCVHVGAPPNGVELFNVTHRYLGFKHPDPKGDHLKDLVEILSDADGADLLHIDWCAFPRCRTADGQLIVKDLSIADYRTPEEVSRQELYSKGSGYLFTYSPIRTIVLHRVPPDSERATLPRPEISSSVWITYELLLAAYCQRVINSGDPVVKSMISPDTLVDPISMIREGVRSGQLHMKEQSELENFIVPNLRRALGTMLPVRDDHRGFRSFCLAAQMGWIKVSYVRRFVAHISTYGDRPFPRRQELPRGTFYEGLPPEGRRKYVVSHGWATEHHPSPSGMKLCKLLAAIDADEGASDDDGIFLDFCSLDQRARPQPAGQQPQRERTIAESRRFYLALWEMTRMYAYGGCRVVVLPEVEPWKLFEPAGTQPEQVYSEVKERVCLRSAVWGWVNEVPYHRRGWCFAEFSCARKAGIIINEHDEAVQAILRARAWPTDVKSYTRDMQDLNIEFTSKGDREYVTYIFNKMSFDPRTAMQV